MTTQSEYILEENLIQQLQELGYTKVVIRNEEDLIQNLKKPISAYHQITMQGKYENRYDVTME